MLDMCISRKLPLAQILVETMCCVPTYTYLYMYTWCTRIGRRSGAASTLPELHGAVLKCKLLAAYWIRYKEAWPCAFACSRKLVFAKFSNAVLFLLFQPLMARQHKGGRNLKEATKHFSLHAKKTFNFLYTNYFYVNNNFLMLLAIPRVQLRSKTFLQNTHCGA